MVGQKGEVKDLYKIGICDDDKILCSALEEKDYDYRGCSRYVTSQYRGQGSIKGGEVD
jgi:hypothetical protein